jgi:hypothetical protein
MIEQDPFFEHAPAGIKRKDTNRRFPYTAAAPSGPVQARRQELLP